MEHTIRHLEIIHVILSAAKDLARMHVILSAAKDLARMHVILSAAKDLWPTSGESPVRQILTSLSA